EIRWRHSSGLAVEKIGPETRLKLPDRAGHRRRRTQQALRPFCDAAFLHDRDERAQMAHDISFLHCFGPNDGGVAVTLPINKIVVWQTITCYQACTQAPTIKTKKSPCSSRR